jgi:plastocyanin domain-containing protein
MKATIIAVVVAVVFIGGAIFLVSSGSSVTPSPSANNVSIVDGKQIIEIQARGGYQPRKSVAKAGIDTLVRFNTSGTFDCSASIRFPSLRISKLLPQTGSTDIDIGTSTLGVLRGSCGMGMYPFEIDFQG